MEKAKIPVITIDGPTASGKGTVAQKVARELGFHYLDSGALYRLTALSVLRRGVALDDEHALAKAAEHLHCHFDGGHIFRPTKTSPRPSAPRKSAIPPPRSPP